MDINKKKKRNFFFFIYIIFVVCSILLVIVGSNFCDFSKKESYIDFSDDWVCNRTGTSLTEISNNCTFEKEIPTINKDSYLVMLVKNINIDVYKNDELCYSSRTVENPAKLTYKASGTYWVNIPILREDSNQTIKIVVDSPYKNDSSCYIKDLRLGNPYYMVINEVRDRYLGFVTCCIIVFLGFIFIIISFVLRKYSDENDYDLIYLGVFSLVIGTWAMVETKFFHLIYENSVFWHLVTGLTLLLLCFPLFLFFRQKHKEANKASVYVMGIISLISYFVSLFLHYFSIKDFHESIWIAHFCVFCGVCFILYFGFLNIKVHSFKDISFIGFFSVAIGVGLDILNYKCTIVDDSSMFTRIGFLGYIVCLGVDIFKKYINNYNTSIKNNLLSKMIYIDILTNFYNRTSFTEKLQNMNKNKTANNNHIIAVFDVNNLKQVNDTLGHSSGDEVIIEASSVIGKYFSNYGKCFRIGGDEFVFISDDIMSTETINSIHNKMVAEIKQRNLLNPEEKPYMLNIAFGYERVNYNVYDSVNDAFDVADKRMYDNKLKIKKELKGASTILVPIEDNEKK